MLLNPLGAMFPKATKRRKKLQDVEYNLNVLSYLNKSIKDAQATTKGAKTFFDYANIYNINPEVMKKQLVNIRQGESHQVAQGCWLYKEVGSDAVRLILPDGRYLEENHSALNHFCSNAPISRAGVYDADVYNAVVYNKVNKAKENFATAGGEGELYELEKKRAELKAQLKPMNRVIRKVQKRAAEFQKTELYNSVKGVFFSHRV